MHLCRDTVHKQLKVRRELYLKLGLDQAPSVHTEPTLSMTLAEEEKECLKIPRNWGSSLRPSNLLEL